MRLVSSGALNFKLALTRLKNLDTPVLYSFFSSFRSHVTPTNADRFNPRPSN